MPGSCPHGGGRSRACTSARCRHFASPAGPSRRSMTPKGQAGRSSRTRCRCRPAPPRSRTRCDERPGGTHVETGRMGAVLAHVRRHQPAYAGLRWCGGAFWPGVAATMGSGVAALGAAGPAWLLDEGHVAPRAGAEHPGVVVGHAEHLETVLGDAVPLLAGDLACLAADADRAVGEESLASRRFRPARVGSRDQVRTTNATSRAVPVGVIRVVPVSTLRPARRRYS